MLRAGPIELDLDGIDLRSVRAEGVELLRRVYVAVRDHNWVTIPGEVSDLEVDDQRDRFSASWTCVHRAGDVDLSWRGTLDGQPDGSLRLEVDGRAHGPFRYNRFGICVLHPVLETRGASYRGRGSLGPVAGALPDLIAPQPFVDGRYIALFDPVSELEVDLPGGGRLELAFEGDEWECEDQRNWTDASLKTYSTPLRLGYPHQAAAGQVLRQALTVRLAGRPPAARRGPRASSGAVHVGGRTGRRLPPIGLGAPSHHEAVSEAAADALRRLELGHLRVDAHPGDAEGLRRGLAAARAIGCPVELALHLTGDPEVDGGLVAGLGDAELARVIALSATAASTALDETTPAELVAWARAAVGDGVPVGGGTDMHFCELNRTRPAARAMDLVAYPAVATVHAEDSRSVVETLEAQAHTVATATAFADGAAVCVSPVTLRPRFNANATGPETAREADALPPEVDPRQPTPLCAAWTLGSIAALAGAGAASLTYFEATGWRGVLETDAGSPLPERFKSRPGEVFAVWHVLRALAGWSGAELLEVTGVDLQRTAALALRRPDGTARLWLANLRDAVDELRVDGRSTTLAPFAWLALDLERP